MYTTRPIRAQERNGEEYYFVNDEINPVKGVDEKKIIEILNGSENVEFTKAFFDLPCDSCEEGVSEKKKFFDFLGFNFYIYTKDGEYVFYDVIDKSTVEVLKLLWRVIYITGKFYEIVLDKQEVRF